MIIIFQCYGGTHSSVAAAAIYTGLLNRHRPPAIRELLALPYFDRLPDWEMGRLHLIGHDRDKNPVFALGSRRWGEENRKLLAGLLAVAAAPEKVAVIDCLPYINAITRVGGFISRVLGLNRFGRPLVAMGMRRGYFCLVRRVEEFEREPQRFILEAGPCPRACF